MNALACSFVFPFAFGSKHIVQHRRVQSVGADGTRLKQAQRDNAGLVEEERQAMLE
jgi:hypothetical protein